MQAKRNRRVRCMQLLESSFMARTVAAASLGLLEFVVTRFYLPEFLLLAFQSIAPIILQSAEVGQGQHQVCSHQANGLQVPQMLIQRSGVAWEAPDNQLVLATNLRNPSECADQCPDEVPWIGDGKLSLKKRIYSLGRRALQQNPAQSKEAG